LEFLTAKLSVSAWLPQPELLCGFAEIIKHALIADADMFRYLDENCSEALALNPQVIEKLVSASIQIKAAVVSRDEHEQGERRKLNFGHTIGHALEKSIGIPHGEAVSIGMAAATALSFAKGFISSEDVTRITDLIKRYHLPVRSDVAPEQLFAAMRKDKKRTGDRIRFVFLKRLGEALVEAITLNDLKQLRLPI